MQFGICPLSTVAIRNRSSHKSEMISQLLFGEMVEVLEQKGRQWSRVRCRDDNFVGWVATQQLEEITPQEVETYAAHYAFALELYQAANRDEDFLPITLGARLPKFDGMRFQLGHQFYTYSGQAAFPEDIVPRARLVMKIARRFLRVPMLWGGRSPLGVDAAGLVQVVYRIAGQTLPREAFQQVLRGTAVHFVEQSLPGDLAFFENRSGRITHTGIIFPDQQILHVDGQVRLDRIDHYGIFNTSQQRYTHRLRIIKRLLPPDPGPQLSLSDEAVLEQQQMELF